jgi:hypothetical protein
VDALRGADARCVSILTFILRRSAQDLVFSSTVARNRPEILRASPQDSGINPWNGRGTTRRDYDFHKQLLDNMS